MLLNLLLLVVGFVLLIYSADYMVAGASSIAKKFNMSELAIGLTIVSIGTSAPELVVNIVSGASGNNDLAFGNVIGSNLFNTFFILGVAGLIYPISVQSQTVWKEIPIMIISGLMILFLINDNFFFDRPSTANRLDGIIMLGVLIAFIIYVLKSSKDQPTEPEAETSKIYRLPISVLMIVGGIAGLIFGGNLVVENAIIIAKSYGVSEKVIGLTIISMGTSLPELATSAVAAFKKRSDIAIGNVVGSNLFNLLLILPMASVVTPLPFDVSMNFDFIVYLIGSTLVFGAMFSDGRNKIDRWEAILLVLAYLGYLIYMLNVEGVF